MFFGFRRRGNTLGRLYREGEVILSSGEEAKALFVVLSGELEVLGQDSQGREYRLGILRRDEVFGEMSLLGEGERMATVRAVEPSRVMTLDRRGILGRFQEDPTLALRLLEQMLNRIKNLNEEVVRLREKMSRAGLGE